jgi:hypothetical protein
MLRLLVYDATQRERPPRALGFSWRYGAHLYRGLGRIDAAHGARSFADALSWLGRVESGRSIRELQFWGHGKWGRIFIGSEALDRSVLGPAHEHHAGFRALSERLAPDALLWFRTCETLGARAGQHFAQALADATGASVAGHTHEIGFFQSGLHRLLPGSSPSWSESEGLSRGSPERPEQALQSSPTAPNTITCFTGRIPEGF